MHAFRKNRGHWRPGMIALVTSAGAALALLTVAAPADGLSVGTWSGRSAPTSLAHDHGVSPKDSSSVAPLNEAIVTVTDLSTNEATVNEWTDPTPLYGGDGCNASTSSPLCLTFGGGPGPNGGSFTLAQSQLQAGQVYDPAGMMDVSAD